MPRKPREPGVNRRSTRSKAEIGAALSRGLESREPAPVSLLDRDGIVLYSSPEVTRLLGYEPAEREGKPAFDIVHPDDLPGAQRAFQDVATQPGEGATLDVRCRCKDGSYRTFEFAGINRLDDPGVGAIVVTYRDVTERRDLERRAQTSEKALAEQNLLLEAIIEASPECMKVISAEGKLIRMNPAGLAMLGARTADELPASLIDMVAPEHRAAFEDMAARVLGGQASQLQFEIIALTGDRRWVEAHAVRVVYPGNPRPVLLAITRDITQRKQAEEALRDSERLYRTLFSAAPIGLGIADGDGTLLAFNDAIRAPGGYSEADIRALGNVARLYANADERDRLLQKARVEGRLNREPVQFLRKDASTYDALMSLEPVQLGGRRGWLAVVEDITLQRRAEAMERQSDERYRTFFSHSTEAFWRFELEEPCPVDWPEDRQIQQCYRHAYLAECNEAMAKMYGYASSAETVGRYLGELLRPDDPANDAAIRDLIRSGYQQTNLEVRERARGGVPKVFQRSLIGIVEDGKLLRVWGTQRDITEHKQMEEQLRQSQKMEAIGRLAGGVAHDFNNLLTAMLGSAEMLLAGLGPSDPRTEDAADIKQAASRAAALTRQLLAFGRRQVLKPQPLDLNRVVGDMQRLLRRLIPEDIELVTRSAPDLWTVLADRGQVEQVLVNLVVNARDAMPDGGVIMVETANAELDAAFAARNPGSHPGSHVALTVRDTGAGMDPETQAHIFEPFFTTKEVGKGTGLGLATVYGIVKQSGGYIAVQSELRAGTSFQIFLPRHTSPTPAVAPAAETDGEPVREHRGGTETILVVEDEERIRVSAKRILEYYGYHVLVAPDGQAGLELLDRSSVELVLSDVVMPRLNGTQLFDAVRKSGNRVPFLFTSGYVGREGRDDVKLDPSVPFLPKPWTVDELVTKVRQILDAGRK